MQTFRGFVTYSDEHGTYSEGADFPASQWADAIKIGRAKATDTARGDFQTLTTLIARNDDGSIASFTARCSADRATALVTITAN